MSGEPQVFKGEVETSNLALTIPIVLVLKRKPLPFQWRQNQTSIHVLAKILCLTGKAGIQLPGNRLPTPARSHPAAFPVGQVC